MSFFAKYIGNSSGGGGSGTVTSVGLADSTGTFTISGSPVTSSGTLTLSGFASQVAKSFLAAPNGGAGAPTFRTIVASDIPTLNQNTTGTASNVTGVVAILNGGTGQTTANSAFNALAPSQTSNSGKFLTTDGTNTSWATVSVSPASTNGAVQFNNSSAFGGDAANFFWDNTNHRLGIGNNSPQQALQVGTAAADVAININGNNTGGGVSEVRFFDPTTAPGTHGGNYIRGVFGGNVEIGSANGIDFFPLSASTSNVRLGHSSTSLSVSGSSGATLLINDGNQQANFVWTSVGTTGQGQWAANPAGVTSVGPVGSSPNGNAAVISGSTLTLEPADGSNPGVVSTGTQTFAGSKTINGTLTVSSNSGDPLAQFVQNSANIEMFIGNGQALGQSFVFSHHPQASPQFTDFHMYGVDNILTITSDARVGINTHTPGNPLTVAGDADIVALSLGTTSAPTAGASLDVGGAKMLVLTSGIIKTSAANESTGSGSASLGSNSPAVTNTAPYRWLTFNTSDGSTVYIPCWK